jgi:hypothetical protein
VLQGGRKVRQGEREMKTETEVGGMQLLTGAMPRNAAGLQELEGMKMNSLQPPEGRRPCPHLHFSPEKLTVDF